MWPKITFKTGQEFPTVSLDFTCTCMYSCCCWMQNARFSPSSFPLLFLSLCLSGGSGHVLVLSFLHSFMLCLLWQRTHFAFVSWLLMWIIAWRGQDRFPPCTCTVLFLFHQSHSLHGHLGWPRYTCPLCVLVLSDIASLLASLLTVLCSVDRTAKHLLLFGCIVTITQCFVSLSVHALLVRLRMNFAHSTVNRYCCYWNNLNHEWMWRVEIIYLQCKWFGGAYKRGFDFLRKQNGNIYFL